MDSNRCLPLENGMIGVLVNELSQSGQTPFGS